MTRIMNFTGGLRLANETRQKEWDISNRITPAFRATELAGETGEACNIVKKLERIRLGIATGKETPEELVAMLADELADIVISADLIAMDYGIDLLPKAVPEKFNKTSDKHGFKTKIVIVDREA